ncbi:MAG: DUF3826 domain-containing protein [Verrucomicrobiota bacterium]|nr:DUF3826 domain-containing protein [Verrucomicrobiota bacterium]
MSTHSSSEQIEANYTRAIERRTADILKALVLSDTNRAARVHDTLLAQWRALRAWHDANDAKLKQAARAGDTKAIAQVRASLKSLHHDFLSKLSADLTPAQVETVKDKMTYGTVEVTYRAYCEIVPGLAAGDKAEILKLLKRAREEAMDCGSAKEKAVVFKRYKGRINNYLNAHGFNVAQAYKEWGERQKLKAAAGGAHTPAK